MIDQDQQRRTTTSSYQNVKNSPYCLEMNEFPGGPYGFELVSRFCHNNGRIKITVSNVSLLHCCSLFLGMHNLQQQTDSFLQDMFYWSWHDVVTCLRSCETFVVHADSCGLLQKLICALLAQNSDLMQLMKSPSSSPETASGFSFSSSSESLSYNNKPSSSSTKVAWWFDDLIVLPPKIIEKIIKSLGAYGENNNSLILTKFLLYYLKSAFRSRGTTTTTSKHDYGGLADTAVGGVISVGKTTAFSCRKLLWVLRLVSGFGVSKHCRAYLERRIGEILDQATLDDLMVSGHDQLAADRSGVYYYDVNLVLRLIRIFVSSDVHYHKLSQQKMKKVGGLIDKYLGEISPDQNLNISKFVRVAESLPDFARDCFDGVYRAIDIYIQSHQGLSLEERSKVCRCLNYKKLSLEACKELAKNPKIPPRIAMEALLSQPSKEMRVDFQLQRMQSRAVELDEDCRDIKGHMLHLLHAPPPITTILFSNFPSSFC